MDLPIRLLNELKKCSDIIFNDTIYFLENYKPKHSILYDNWEFNKYKNLFTYDMEIIYSYTPKNKILESFSDNKKIENETEVKNIFKENENEKNQIADNKLFYKNEKSLKGENNIDANNKINEGCLNIPNSCFFPNKIFKNNTNSDNICFLNTKRIQKITTPISTKIINSSPFKEKTILLLKKNNTAFRNLKNQFEEK